MSTPAGNSILMSASTVFGVGSKATPKKMKPRGQSLQRRHQWKVMTPSADIRATTPMKMTRRPRNRFLLFIISYFLVGMRKNTPTAIRITGHTVCQVIWGM